MFMGDFNIDFKNRKDSNLEKLNNFCDTFSHSNLEESMFIYQQLTNLQLVYF